VRFLGAARGIGGSMLAVEAGGQQVLLDCGRPIRGRREAPQPFPTDPASAAAIVVSHAHQDHSGWLLDYSAAGFAGPIYCTVATRDLIAVQMAETARRYREDMRVAAIIKSGSSMTSVSSLEGMRDRIRCCEFDTPTEIESGATITMCRAGHLLGAAGVLLEWHNQSVYFTGDLGRDDSPLYSSPEAIPQADLIVSESTYGDRNVESFEIAAERLGAIIRRTIEDGGRVIIPAFSLGRMQLVLLAIAENRRERPFPAVPIIVDSPTAHPFAEVHRRHRRELRDANIDDAWFGADISYAESDDSSRAAAESHLPAIVLVAGGMADSYRAKRHITGNIDDPRCRIVLVSFQAPGTLGRRLLDRGPTVRIDGQNYNKWAEVVQLGGFSGHADRDELLKMLTPLGRTGRPIHLVHGELPAANTLAQALRDNNCMNVTIPAQGDAHRLRSLDAVG
jgi:metallo-beta-lactamase family protein